MILKNVSPAILCLFSCVFFMLLASDTPAESTLDKAFFAESSQRQEIQSILNALAANPQVESVKENKKQIKTSIAGYKQRVASVQKEINQLEAALKGIGEKGSGEPPIANRALSELIALKQQKEQELVELRMLVMTAEEAVGQLDDYIRMRESKDNFFRGEPLWKIFSNITAEQTLGTRTSYTKTPKNNGTLLLLASLTALFFACSFLQKVQELIKTQSSSRNIVHILMRYMIHSTVISRLIFGLTTFLTLFIALAFFIFSNQPLVIIGSLIIFFYLVLRMLLQATLLRFKKEGSSPALPSRNEAGSAYILYGISLISAIIIVFSSDYNPYQNQTALSEVLSSLLFFGWLLFLFLCGRMFCRVVNAGIWRFARLPLAAALLLLFVLELLGYRNLTDHITLAIAYSFIVFCLALILYDSIDLLMVLFKAYTEGAVHRFALEPVAGGRRIKTHKILGFVLKIYILLSAIVLVMHQWEITDVGDDRLLDFFLEGSHIGGFTISPVRITLAILFFILVWPAIEYLKQIINRRWLSSADMSMSSRDTFLTVSGYVGYAFIILITIGLAGVKLTGLTVIIGALSVGIGFGLQNVVNNFISGLILMFERPIKKGDWILVGSTEGYVKKISIRSTIVQTFDRSDVIVPNSELISSQVTNMMFEDQRGRVRVSVGVAYGSDTELVQRLLLDVAHAHRQVIKDESAPEPRVYFQAFGESSLDFDLLAHIKDIDLKLRVRSELNMAVDKAFREHGIEIPFPQRDVHMKER